MQANAGAIGVSAVSKVFPSGLEALRGVSVEIHPGEFVSFVGPSGCGKSTLLKLIGGLLEPSTGEITVGGRKGSGPRRDVGVMFQTSVLFPRRTLLENVLLPIEIFGLERSSALDKARGLLRLVGLEGREGAEPRALSGGRERRGALSRGRLTDAPAIRPAAPLGRLDPVTPERMKLALPRSHGLGV